MSTEPVNTIPPPNPGGARNLDVIVVGTGLQVVGHGRVLAIAGRPVAAIEGELDATTCWRIWIGNTTSAAEVLAGLCASKPNGIFVLEAGGPDALFAFEFVDGRLRGAMGGGPLDTLSAWLVAHQQERPEMFVRAEEDGKAGLVWPKMARTFIQECMLELLSRAEEGTAQALFFQGNARWLGERLEPNQAPELQFLLLEHARRADEIKRILKILEPLDRLVVPQHAPDRRPTADDDDPEGEASEEASARSSHAEDVTRVFEWCDGFATLGDVIERAMLGFFRGAAALATLIGRGHVVVIESQHVESNVLSLDLLGED